jgi:hypothetical protein
MFRRNASAIPGKESAKTSGSKNAFLTSGHPGEVTTITAISAKKTNVLAVAIRSERVPPSPPRIRDRRLPAAATA